MLTVLRTSVRFRRSTATLLTCSHGSKTGADAAEERTTANACWKRKASLLRSISAHQNAIRPPLEMKQTHSGPYFLQWVAPNQGEIGYPINQEGRYRMGEISGYCSPYRGNLQTHCVVLLMYFGISPFLVSEAQTQQKGVAAHGHPISGARRRPANAAFFGIDPDHADLFFLNILGRLRRNLFFFFDFY